MSYGFSMFNYALNKSLLISLDWLLSFADFYCSHCSLSTHFFYRPTGSVVMTLCIIIGVELKDNVVTAHAVYVVIVKLPAVSLGSIVIVTVSKASFRSLTKEISPSKNIYPSDVFTSTKS